MAYYEFVRKVTKYSPFFMQTAYLYRKGIDVLNVKYLIPAFISKGIPALNIDLKRVFIDFKKSQGCR